MNCRRAQTDIALWAGNDLDETDRLSLRRHLEACPDCREYQAQMQALMQLVDECPLKDEADEASKSAVSDSLWPSLSSHLVSLPSAKSDRFNGWIPAIAVAAVCLAMLMVASPQSAFPPKGDSLHSDAMETNWPQPVSDGSPSSIGRMDRGPVVNVRMDDAGPFADRDEFYSRGRLERIPALTPGFSEESEFSQPLDPRELMLRELFRHHRLLYGLPTQSDRD